jgi:RHH-type rel operon transcriptional repressor/antitoxin RelB
MSTTMTLRLEEDVRERLDKLAYATHRSKSYLAAEAVREYLVNNEWQIGEIQAALAEAQAGDFAGDDEVAALKRKWKPGVKASAKASVKASAKVAGKASRKTRAR